MLVSVLTETAVEIIGKAQKQHYVVYHFFVPLEYTLVTLLLRSAVRNRNIQRAMLLSVFFFWPLSLFISFFVQRLTAFPGISGGVEGMLIILWCLLTLLFIEPRPNLSIFRLPVFWMALGFMAYFVGTTTFNTVYNHLYKTQTARAEQMFNLFNNVSNYVLYIFLIIGILCHKARTKSSAPLSSPR